MIVSRSEGSYALGFIEVKALSPRSERPCVLRVKGPVFI